MEMKTIRSLFTDEPLSDEECLANYRKKQQENQKVERELKKRLENRVLVRERFSRFICLHSCFSPQLLVCFYARLCCFLTSNASQFDRRSSRSTKVDSIEDCNYRFSVLNLLFIKSV